MSDVPSNTELDVPALHGPDFAANRPNQKSPGVVDAARDSDESLDAHSPAEECIVRAQRRRDLRCVAGFEL